MINVVRRKNETSSVRINVTLTGEPASWLRSWKERGLVKSNADAIRQAFRAFNEQIIEFDVKAHRARNHVNVDV